MRNDERSFFDEPEFKQALASYEAMISEGTSAYLEAEDLTDIAEYYMVNKRREDAIACIEYALELHPDSVDPLVFLAREEMFNGNLERAWERCVAISNQNDREVIFLRAELLIRSEQPDEAARFLMEKYNRINEEAELFLHDCIDICFDYHLYNIALEWSKLLVEKHPKYKIGKQLLAESTKEVGNISEAITLLEQELDANPYDWKMWTLLGECYLSDGRCEEAIDAAEYALAIQDDNTDALYVKADSLFHLNRLEESHESYQRMLNKQPEDEEWLFQDAVCLTAMERYEEAMALVEHSLSAHPEYTPYTAQTLVQKAYLLSKIHRTDEALETLEQCKAVCTDADHLEYDIIKGHILLENAQVNEAGLSFRKAMEKAEDQTGTLCTIATSYCECHYVERALSLFEIVEAQGTPTQREFSLPYLAFCYYQLHRDNDYLRVLPEAVKKNPETCNYLLSPIYPGVPVSDFVQRAQEEMRGL